MGPTYRKHWLWGLGDIRYEIKVCSVTIHSIIMESDEEILPHRGEAGCRILSPLTCDPSLCSELGQLRPPSVTTCVMNPRHRTSSSSCVPETVGGRTHADNVFLPLTEIFASLWPPLIILSSSHGAPHSSSLSVWSLTLQISFLKKRSRSAFAHAKLSDRHGKALKKAPEIYGCLSLFAFILHGTWELFLWDVNTSGEEDGGEKESTRDMETDTASKRPRWNWAT